MPMKPSKYTEFTLLYFPTVLLCTGTVKQVRVSHRALVDACASWWTQGAGHGNPGMALAVAEAAGRYGHVIFPGNIHAPALEVNF